MRACLVIHGLSSSPPSVASIREHLVAAGFAVAIPCLAGHGATIEALARSTWQDWYATVRASYNDLRKTAERVDVVGHSLGAVLALKLAIDEGAGVGALALLGTSLVLQRASLILASVLRYSPLRYAIRSAKKDFAQSVGDPEGRRIYEASALPRMPAESVYQLLDLNRIVLADLRKVTQPILLVHARGDRVAPARNVDVVRRGVSSRVVETLLLEESRHVILLDVEKDRAAEEVVLFFERMGRERMTPPPT